VQSTFASGQDWSGQDWTYWLAIETVPEPSALGLLAIGMFWMTLLSRRQH
jgi:hypothetical protein